MCAAALLSARKERERRSQAVRRSAPDLAVLTRLKAQMAEVRSKMADVKGQLEARAGVSDARITPLCSVLDHGASTDPETATRRKPRELDLLFKVPGTIKHGRHGTE